MLQPEVLLHLGWADDLWLYTSSQDDLNAMLADVAKLAHERIGLRIWWGTCSFVKVSPTDPNLSSAIGYSPL